MPPKGTKTTSSIAKQPSLKASWAAAKSGKNAVLAAEKKKQQQHQVPFAPVITSVSAPQEAVRRSPRKLQRKLSVSDEEEHISSSSDDDDSEAEPVSPIGETEDDRESAKPEVHEIIQTESEEEVKEIPQLTVKEKKAVTGRSKLKAKTGNAFNVHAQSEDRIHRILRIFDLSYEYGPCVGVTRLERWKRAEELGLNPPTEVRDLLLSEKGEGELGENVFHRRV